MAELLHLSLEGIPKWQQWTEDMIARAQDMRPVFEVMYEAWIVEVQEQFATEGAYYGDAWAPLNEKYAERKRRQWGLMPILIASGAMLKSFLGGHNHVKVIEADHAAFGSTDEKARYHQEGTEHMPARPIVKASDALKQVGAHSAVLYILTGDAGGH